MMSRIMKNVVHSFDEPPCLVDAGAEKMERTAAFGQHCTSQIWELYSRRALLRDDEFTRGENEINENMPGETEGRGGKSCWLKD
jgi:hypothetical protein